MKNFFKLAMVFVATMILASSCDKESIHDPGDENTVNFTATKFVGGHMVFGKSGMYIVSLSDEENIHSYIFTLNNNICEADDNGYVTIPSGTYTQSGATGNYTIAEYAVYTDKSEGAEIPTNTTITGLTVEVTENKIVMTTTIEGVTHIVTYNGPLSMPGDLPDPNIDFAANKAYAYYTESTSEENAAKFKLFLSDKGRDEKGNVLPNGIYYRLTLSVDKLDSIADVAIPAGRYVISDTSSAPGYIADARYYKFGEDASEAVDNDFITSGYLIVNEDGSIEASFDMYFSDATHNVTFSGDVEILENTIPSEAPYSTLTSNKVCNLSNHSFSCYYGKETYGSDYQSWTISIYPENYVGDEIAFEILYGTDGDTNISGKYTISNSLNEYTAIPGYVEGFTLMSSWYYHRANALHISDYAPIVEGWVEIQTNDDGNYTITFDVYDDLNNNITGTYTSVVPSKVANASFPTISL